MYDEIRINLVMGKGRRSVVDNEAGEGLRLSAGESKLSDAESEKWMENVERAVLKLKA